MFKRTPKHQHHWEEVRREPHQPTGEHMKVKGWGSDSAIEAGLNEIAKSRDGWTAVELRCTECGDIAYRELIGITINPPLIIEATASEIPWTPVQLARGLRMVADVRERKLKRTSDQGPADSTGGSEGHRIARLRTAADILDPADLSLARLSRDEHRSQA